MPSPECYSRWWHGKLCRQAGSRQAFRRVVRVQWCGPPSGVYGFVVLHYEDGDRDDISAPLSGFRPRKTDVEVKEE